MFRISGKGISGAASVTTRELRTVLLRHVGREKAITATGQDLRLVG